MGKWNILLIFLVLGAPFSVWKLSTFTSGPEEIPVEFTTRGNENSYVDTTETLEILHYSLNSGEKDDLEELRSVILGRYPQLSNVDSSVNFNLTVAAAEDDDLRRFVGITFGQKPLSEIYEHTVIVPTVAIDPGNGESYDPGAEIDEPEDRPDPATLSETESSGSKLLLLSALLIIGIFAGEVYRTLSKDDSEQINLSDFKQVLFSKSLWKSIFASPLIFFGIYYLSQEQTDVMISSLLAFENGFFCNVILSKKEAAE